MLFHTWTFALFFLIVYPVYLAIKGTRFRLPWLLAASYVFYGWWSPRYLLLIVYATAVDYAAVMLMSWTRRGWLRRLCLFLSVANGLMLLGQFKYADFLVRSLNDGLAWAGIGWVVPPPRVIWPVGLAPFTRGLNVVLGWVGLQAMPPFELLLPVGISFYVFQSMSYSIDYYRGNVQREPNFIRYATFVSLFPQLVAGPIERAKNLLPQLQEPLRVTPDDVADGASLFVVGLFKKVALADYLSLYVDKVYAVPDKYQAPALLLATFAFAWQIYFDFSGYTDMARGIGRMMGIRLMLNFNNPYLATGLGDFWRRWHISLSTWFKDYVYVPLGGSRSGRFVTWITRGLLSVLGIRWAVKLMDRCLAALLHDSWRRWRSRMGSWLRECFCVRLWKRLRVGFFTYVNMVLTMLVSGLWHGANWTFVIWGALHAAGRVLTRGLEESVFYRRRLPVFLKRASVFAFVTFAWIFFRAASFDDARLIVRRIFGRSGWVVPASATSAKAMLQWFAGAAACPLLAIGLVLAVWIYQAAYESRLRRVLQWRAVRIGLVVLMVLYMAIFVTSDTRPFIYFQF